MAAASAATIITVQPTPVTAASITEVPYTWTVSLIGDTIAGPISRSRFSNGSFSSSDSLSANVIVSFVHTPPENAQRLDPLPTDVEVVLSATFSVSQLIRTTTNLTSIATADASVNADSLSILNLGIGSAPNGDIKFESLRGFLGEGSFNVSGELNVFVACNATFCNNPPGAPTPRVTDALLSISAGLGQGSSGIIRYEEEVPQTIAFPVGIVPPSNLELNNTPISKGIFNLTSITGWSANQPNGFSITPPPPNLSFNMTVGDTNPIILFQAPDDTEVLRVVGFFDSTEPDEPLANFDLIVGPINFTSGKRVPEWTYYLPAMTGMTTFQVTDVGSSVALGDNTNYFLSEAALSIVPDRPAGTPGVDFLIIDNGINEWFVNIKPASLVGETVADEPFSPGGTPWDVPIGTQRTSVPEPTSTLSLLALGTLGLGSTLKRQLKVSQSTEKETTKVG